MEIKLFKDDIFKVGHTMFSNDGNVAILFDVNDDSIGLGEILIRNVLTLFGDEYKITDSYDFGVDEDDNVESILVQTNLPWTEIEALHK